MRLSFVDQLSVLLTVLLGIILSTLFWFVDVRIDAELYGRFDRGLQNRLNLLADMQGVGAGGVKSNRLERWLPEYAEQGHTAFYQIWDAQGATVARSESSNGRDLPAPPALEPGAPALFYDVVLPDGHDGRAALRRYALPAGDSRGSLSLMIAEERTSLDALERSLHFALLGGTALALVLAIIAVRWVAVRTLAPLQRLGEAASKIDPDGKLNTLEVQGLPAELAPMADKINVLLERLFATIARERRYARDLAHELRTPMAETRAIAEVALLTGDHEALRHSLTEIAAIGAEMQRVVETLLMLARYEAGMDRLIAEPVELVALVRAQLRRLDDGIRGKRIRFVLSLPQEAWVLADASACERILSNLLGNAVAHAPENSVASIDLFDKGGGYQLLIGNAAPRLRSDDMAQLSGRFYRGDAPPNRHHAGLGLALALALAKAQGLAMQWQLDEGLRFQVSLRGFAPLPD
ncbi:MAG: two-component sensor histidine kinase [Lysobacterales bacterium CG17_big_fil_post_rev_8_21_14_2_50_64_11]|nr:MAG: two-component sensor histidine kinase [Xanthomonadales bacterium CG17_big_fil_post_rev_8_21_14_2_50_64_11]PIX61379.1 MAG: two-component sensor histidine kinase [Xanthomonadales bacterium CG_4_10_14_3_um_filter_64_11]